MTGWRLGWCTHEPIAKAIDAVQSHSTSNPTSFAQKGRSRRSLAPEHLPKVAGGIFQAPHLRVQQAEQHPGITLRGARARSICSRTFRRRDSRSADFCAKLLEQERVAAVSGIAFGRGRLSVSAMPPAWRISKGWPTVRISAKDLK